MANDLSFPSPDKLPVTGGWGSLPPLGPPPSPEGRNNQTPKWQRYLAAVKRHRWIVLAVTILGTAAGVVALRFVKPKYLAQVTIWVEVGDQGHSSRGPIRSGELLKSYAWLELLRSYAVLDHVVRDQRLYIESRSRSTVAALQTLQLGNRFRPGEYRIKVDDAGQTFVLSTSEGMEIQRGKVGEPVGADLGFQWTPTAKELPAGQELKFAINNPRDVARELGDRLETRMAPEGNFVGLALRGTDRMQITATVNAVADRYVEVAGQLKRAKLDELAEVLNEQRQYAEGSLKDAEMSLESFRVNTVTLPSDQSTPVAAGLQITRDPVFQSFFEMRLRRDALRRDRESIEHVLATRSDTSFPVAALSFVGAVEASPELQGALAEDTEKRVQLRALRQRYTDEYPPLVRLRQDIRTLESVTLPRLAGQLASELAAKEAELSRQIDKASEELRQIPPRSIEEGRLQRAVAVADNLHGTLRQRYEEARLAAASTIPDVRILDRAATPYEPVDDPRPIVVLLGILGGLGLSIAGVVLRDHVDPRIRYPDQVTQGLGLAVLGAIPHLAAGSGNNEAEGLANVAEALREIRLGLLHACGPGPLVLTVSSPESGDGKSFFASNLALSFADQGYRTLLIDGDIRRGDLHHLLDGRRSPGLTDFLAGNASHEEIIQTTRFRSLSLIGSGKRMREGPELLGSAAMSQLLADLKSYFNVIVIDSAPLGAGVDPFQLGTLSGNMVLVLRTGCTDRDLADARLTVLDRLPVRVLGAVLNDVPRSELYRYYSYLPGYRAQDEVGADEVAQLPRA